MVSSTQSHPVKQEQEGVSSNGGLADSRAASAHVEGTAETGIEVDSAVGEVTASTAHSPQRPAGSTVSINAQASTGENLPIDFPPAETLPVNNPAVQNLPDSSRPTDDQIIAQENLIRAETADRAPLVGTLQPLAELEKEYIQGSQVFVQKIRSLAKTYDSIRRVRGDGNCFIRAFLFGLLEHVTKQGDLKERNRQVFVRLKLDMNIMTSVCKKLCLHLMLVTCLRQWVPKLKEGGFTELVFEDSLEMLIDQLNSLGQRDSLTIASLEENFRDDMISNMTVMFIRIIISCEIQRRQDFFAPFVMGMVDEEIDVKQFCTRHVEVMGTESDHVHIVALSDALQVPVRVLYLDRSMGAMMAGVSDSNETTVNHHDFIPEGLQQVQPNVQPSVMVLYRPGHYDLIYPHATS